MDWYAVVSFLVALFAGLGIVEAIKTGVARFGFVELHRDFERSSFYAAIWFMALIAIVALVMAFIMWRNPIS